MEACTISRNFTNEDLLSLPEPVRRYFRSCALQPYIHWSESTPDSAAATIRFNGAEARGSFYFNDRNEYIRFETDDRWQAGKGGKLAKTHWMVTASDYVEDRGIRRPRRASAAWLQKDRSFEYFKGKINGIL